MTFLDSLGGIAQGIGDFTGLTDAWHDMASAFTDNGENDSALNDVGQAIRGLGRTALSPVTTAWNTASPVVRPALEADAKAVHLATSGLGFVSSLQRYEGVAGAGPTWSHPGESFGDYARRSWDKTVGGGWDEGLSLGEISVAGVVGLGGPNAKVTSASATFGKVSPLDYSSQQRDSVFRGDGAPLKFYSGSVDLLAGSLLDPANLLPGVGKAARLAYAGKTILADGVAPRALQGAWQISQSHMDDLLNRGLSASESDIGTHFQWLADNDATTIAKSKEAKRSGDTTTFANLMGQASTPEDVRDTYTLLARIGKPEDLVAARDRLMASGAARGIDPQGIQYVLERVVSGAREAGDVVDGLIQGQVLDQHSALFLRELGSTDSAIGRAYQQTLDKVLANPAPVVRQSPGTGAFLRQNERVATKRASRYATALPGVSLSQPTRFHPIMAVVDFATRERTSGYINFHESDSINEIAAVVDDIDSVVPGSMRNTGEGRAWINAYASAATNSDRMRIAMAIEQRGFEVLSASKGFAEDGTRNISVESAQALWTESYKRRAAAMAQHRERGFLAYLNGDDLPVVAKIPLLERQGANTLPLMDFRQVASSLNRHESGVIGKVMRNSARDGAAVMDVVNDVFKMSVLLRLGYTVRNLAEAGASVFVSGYMGHVLATAGKDSFAAFKENRRAGIYRVKDSNRTRRGLEEDPRVAARTLAQADADVRSNTMILDGVKDGALARAEINVSPADQDILRRLHAESLVAGGAGRLGGTQPRLGGLAGPGRARSDLPRSLTLGGVAVPTSAYHELSPEAVTRLEGRPMPSVHEVTDPSAFRDAITTAAADTPTGTSVHVYDNAEYADMRLFVTDDGHSGFALKGDEIVSVFSADAAPRGRVHALMAHAKSLGGRRLDAFDTRLPGIYARSGFVPTARTSFVDEFAPEGWDYNLYSEHNGGRPDVVFMQYDPAREGKAYRPTAGRRYDTYDEAAAATSPRLTPAERARALEVRGHLSNLAQLRAETTRQTTYHATSNPDFSEIAGDYIDTTPSHGVANARSTDVYTTISWHSASGDVGFALAPAQGTTNQRFGAGYGRMLDEAQAAIEAGKVVQVRRGSTWRPLSAVTLSTLRTRPFRNGDQRALVRFRDAGEVPSVVPVTSYGNELDLRNFADWPASLREHLDVQTARNRSTPQRRANKPSHQDWVARQAWNDPEVAQALTAYAREHGIGRIKLPSQEWGSTVRVIKDTVDGLGGQGARPMVRRNVEDLVTEASQNTTARVLPPVTRTRAENKAARRDLNRRAAKTPRQRLNGVPVTVGYSEAHVQSMLDQGILPAIQNATQELTDARMRAEYARTAMADVRRRQELGKSTAKPGTLPFYIQTEHGPVEVPGEFAGAQGEINRRATSSEATNEHLVGNGTANLSAAIPQAVPTRTRPNEPHYFDSWSNILNMHWRDPTSGRLDPVVERLLNGEDPSVVEGYLKSTSEGRAYADEIGWSSDEIPRAVHILTQAIPLYLPTPELVALWRAGRLDAEGLSARLGGRTDLPEVNGLLVPQSREYADEIHLRSLTAGSARKVFHYLGALPETTFARHPLFKAVYAQQMNDLVPYAAAKKGAPLTLDEVNAIASTARETARKQVNKTLFTINRRTGASQNMRLLSPFYAAWENTMRRWGTMAVEHTEGIARGAAYVNRYLHNANLVNSVTGEKGDLSKEDLRDLSMILPFKVGGFDTKTPLTSMDVITQGQPGNPGIGPFVAAPLAEIIKARPRTEEVLGWAFPAGVPQNAYENFLPAFAKKQWSSFTEDQTFVNDANRIAQMEYIRYQRGERPDLPKWSEVEDKTKTLYALKSVANLTAPFSIQFTNEVSYYTQELNKYRKLYGNDQGEQVFLQQRPEAFVVLQSLSDNKTGVRATLQSVDNLTTYKDLAAEADGLGDPQMLGWLANFGQGEYDPLKRSDAAYDWQARNGAIPGGDTYRSRKNPEEVYAQAEVTKGWTEFRGFMDAIESQLTQMNIDPGSAQGMAVTKQARKIYGQAASTVKPEWYADYMTNDKSRFDKRVTFFESVLADDKFMENHQDDRTIGSIRTFLDLRAQMANTLVDTGQTGGSKRLGAKSNGAVAEMYNQRISALKASNLGFADWYDRYFTNDPVVL